MFKYMSIEIRDYKRFKEKLDIALTNTADNMVHVGYLLAQARDTDILKESGYSGMGEFAREEYGLTPDQTSRFIAIAERYGDGEGRLKDEWQQYGYSKLSEMLSLPEEVAKAIPPEISREEIRELKTEIKKEQEVTPIELAIEKAETEAKEKEEGTERSQLAKFLFAFFRDHPAEFKKLLRRTWELSDRDADIEALCRTSILDTLCSGGIGILSARIPGEGGYLLTFNGEENEPYLTSSRTGEKAEAGWTMILRALVELSGPWKDEYEVLAEPEEYIWSEIYGEEYPDIQENDTDTGKKQEKKVKIAPAQKPGSRISTPQDRNAKKEKPENKPVAEDKKPESRISTPQDGDAKNENAETTGVTEAENPESRISTPQDGDGEKKGDILPTPIREPKIKDQVKRINRLALDLGDYAHRLEKLTANNNYDNVSTLFFNLSEFYTKLQGEGEYLIELLKMRWDDEDYFDEEQEAEDE